MRAGDTTVRRTIGMCAQGLLLYRGGVGAVVVWAACGKAGVCDRRG